MTKDYRTNWMMPAQPLGPVIRDTSSREAIRAGKARGLAKRAMRVIFEFEDKCHGTEAEYPSKPQQQAPGAVTPGTEPQATTPVAAAPFKAGDRVRVVNYLPPGSSPYGNGDEGTVARVTREVVVCRMDCKPQGFFTHWVEASNRLELIKPDTEWHSGPPPHAGWWMAECMPASGLFGRHWNGHDWSACCLGCHDAAERAAMRSGPESISFIVWRHGRLPWFPEGQS